MENLILNNLKEVCKMAIQEIATISFDRQNVISCNTQGISDGFIKLLIKGELDGQGRDSRLLLRLNGANSSYRSFVHMGGDYGAGEWDETGFYVGRSGWHLDATFSAEYIIAVNSRAHKITGSGSSIFGHGDNRILGYESHGHIAMNGGISKIDVILTGGVATGEVRCYLM